MSAENGILWRSARPCRLNINKGRRSAVAEIIEIDEFESAFPVGPKARDEVMRRFSTLLLDTSQPRRYGSNGIVSKAHNVFGETFAIKRLRAGLEETPLPDIPPAKASSGAAAAFRKEYESQLVVSNMRGFPKLYGYGTFGDAQLIIMEWVEGTSLAELFSTGPKLDAAAVMAIGAELFTVLSNLDSLSARPVHRDLSPSNIIVKTHDRSLEEQIAARDFDICIIDFGSTTLIDEQNPSFTALTSILRHATPEYAPPEMLTETLPNILELRQSPAIDVYAACSVLYEVLAGRTPYRVSEHPCEVPYLLKTSSSAPPLHIDGYEEACAMIMRGLSDDPDQRPSAAEMRDVFLRASGKDPMTGSCAAPVQVQAGEAAQQVLPMQQGKASVRDASFEHARSEQMQEGTQPATRKKGVSRRGFIALAGAIGLVVVGGGATALLRSSLLGDKQEEDAQPVQSVTLVPYSGGALYSAQDIESGLWGYLNSQRQWVIPPTFPDVPGLFVDGLACVKDPESGNFGYIDQNGDWTLEPIYPAANMFGDGLAFVQAPREVTDVAVGREGVPLGGWIDMEGNWAIEPKYYGGGVFTNGLATFTTTNDVGQHWGYLDKEGNVVIEERFRDAGPFSEDGLAMAAEFRASYGWIDINGAWVIQPRYGRASSFSEGLAPFMNGVTEKWGYLDTKGVEVLPEKYASARLFKNGVAAVKDVDSGLWGYVKQNGTWAIEPKFARAGDFAHGLAPAQDAETQYFGYIDDTGHWVIPPQYESVNLNVME